MRRIVAVAVAVVVAVGFAACSQGEDPALRRPGAAAVTSAAVTSAAVTSAAVTSAAPGSSEMPEVPQTPAAPTVPPTSPAATVPATATVGYLTFRGDERRAFTGLGPVPAAPQVLWTFPGATGGGLCARSAVGSEVSVWCGLGWTGQVNVWERPGGGTWLLFGALDGAYHALDAATGSPVLPRLRTGDINKGSATVDPDGYPLYYGGSRDNLLRVMALDRSELAVLWSLDARTVSPRMWNDDWDGAGLVWNGHLVVGGENSNLHVIELNRGYDSAGKVTVAPRLVFAAPGWDDELLRGIGDRNVSIESSVTLVGDVAYFANSGGLVQGWDLSPLRTGGAPQRVFRFWTGDDTDATVVADEAGMLYVASEYERRTARAAEVGQLIKLDPSRPGDPQVWGVEDQGYRGFKGGAGIWSTPALHRGTVISTTNGGRLFAVDATSGALLWEKRLAGHLWSSPVVVDDVLIQGDCDGWLRGYDVRDPRNDPPLRWEVKLSGCIEATPTVWKGRIYVGTRAGALYALG